MQPLQPCALSPIGAIENTAGVIIVCCSSPHQKRNLKAIDISRHKSLLLRGAQTYPQDVRLRFPHLSQNFHFLFRSETPKGGSICPNYLQTWKSSLKHLFQELRHAQFATIQKVPIASLN